MQNFSFSAEDININQQGTLSHNQIEKLKEHVFFSFDKNAKMWLVVLPFAFGALFVSGAPAEAFWSGSVLLLMYPLASFITLFLKRRKLALNKIDVQSIHGKVEVYYDSDAARVTGVPVTAAGAASMAGKFAGMDAKDHCYVVKVVDKVFYVDKPVHDFFENGQEYTIYYIQPLKFYKKLTISRGVVLTGAIILSAQKRLDH